VRQKGDLCKIICDSGRVLRAAGKEEEEEEEEENEEEEEEK